MEFYCSAKSVSIFCIGTMTNEKRSSNGQEIQKVAALPRHTSLLAGVIVTHAHSRFFGKSGYDLGGRQPISSEMIK